MGINVLAKNRGQVLFYIIADIKVALIFLLLFSAVAPAALGVEVTQIGKIELSQEKSLLMAATSFIKTEDDIFIIPDYKDGNLKLYDLRGNLIKVWGKRGPGPLEFLRPVSCDYKEPLLSIFDFGKLRIFVYKRVGSEEFEKVSEFVCPNDKANIKLIEDQVLIAGYFAVSDKKQYGLYTINLKDGNYQYLLPVEVKYGFTSFGQFDSHRMSILPLGNAGYCDVYGDFIYFVWEGDLRIIKINRATKGFEFFGERTANYIKPKVTKKLEEGFQMLSHEVVQAEFSKMSFVTGIFADENFIGVIYQNYDKKSSLWKMFLQLYAPEGRLLYETALSNAVTYINFRANNSFYDRSDHILYYLSITYDEKTAIDKYEIIEYKIEM